MSAQEDNGSVSSGLSGMDEKAKKKMQNSARWKRWWSKNREAYNEKRRLSAQQKSAKTRAEKHKRPLRDEEDEEEEEDDDDSGSVPRSHPHKRARRSTGRAGERDEVVSASSFESVHAAGTPPTVSPKFGMHDVISPNLLTISRSLPMAPMMMSNPVLHGLGQFKTLSPFFGIPHQAPPRPAPFMYPGALQQALQANSQAAAAPIVSGMFYQSAMARPIMPGLAYGGTFIHHRA